MDNAEIKYLIMLFQITFIVGAVVHSYTLLVNRWYAQESLSWPTAEGVIRSATVKEIVCMSEYGGTIIYRAKVYCDFTVDGIVHTSDSIAVTEKKFGDGSNARRYLEQFSVGKKVPIYYDPTNLAFAVLQPGFSEAYKEYEKSSLRTLAIFVVGGILTTALNM